MELTNGPVSLSIDDRTGDIIRLVDTRSQTVHLDARAGGRQDGRLFRCIVPSSKWQSRYADSNMAPPPKIQATKTKIVLDYPQLVTPEGALPISAKVVIDASAGNDEIRFTLEIHNDSDGDITDVVFPWLGGWTGLSGPGQDRMTLGGGMFVDPHDFPKNLGLTYLRKHQRQFIYSLYLPCPCLDVSGTRGGLGYIIYYPEARSHGFTLENMTDNRGELRLAFGLANFTCIRPGQTWTSPTVGLSMHQGDWRDTADRYAAWRDTWYQPVPTPLWARQAIGFQNVFFRGFEGVPFRQLDAIPQVAKIGRQYGVDHLCVWDYNMLGMYSRTQGDDIFDYTPEEKTTLRRALRQATDAGSQVSALVNWRLTTPHTSLFKQFGDQEIVRAYNGSPLTHDWSCSQYGPAAQATHLGPISHPWDARGPAYRQRVKQQAREYYELGFTSLFYDQPFEFPSYAFENQPPDTAHTAAISLAGELQKITQAMSPQGILIGENGDTFGAQHINLWMQWYTQFDEAILGNYGMPQTIRSWVVDDDVSQAVRAFAIGSQLCLCPRGNEGTLNDVPELAAHVAKMAKLRMSCGPRYHDAIFRHTRGINLKTDGDAIAYAFDSPQGPAVVVAAPQTRTTATVSIDRNAFAKSTASQGRVMWLDGDTKTSEQKDQLTFDLKAQDIVIWMP